MKVHDQVASQPLSKKLAELGVPQESYFYWGGFENPLTRHFKADDVPEDYWMLLNPREKSKFGHDWHYSAFTVAELGEILPTMCVSFRAWDKIYGEENWIIQLGLSDESLMGNSEANARAKMLIHLIENKIFIPKIMRKILTQNKETKP